MKALGPNPRIDKVPIFCYFNQQRFIQAGSMDCANWYGVTMPDSKNEQAMYPAMGRQHIGTSFGENKLIYNTSPSRIFKSINYFYVIEGTQVIQVDKFFNERVVGTIPLGSVVWSSYLPVNDIVYVGITTGANMYIITENANGSFSFDQVTDNNFVNNPTYIATFGNRFVVSEKNTPNFGLSQVNFAGSTASGFTINGAPLRGVATGVIGQMCVLHNQLYIMCDFTTDIWANIPSQTPVTGVQFPFKLNSSYNWDYGIADPESLSVDFGMMTWLARNTGGLRTFMVSNGQQPEPLSTQAVNVLLQNSNDTVDNLSPFITGPVYGFLYQYENTIFYRVSAGNYDGYAQLDIQETSSALEFNFSTKRWNRVIELNGERNRVQQHVFFANTHLVTVLGDNAIYQMAGNIYHNELRTPNTNAQAPNAFTKYPMRYTLTTPQIFEEDYSEFITDYLEIDFVYGDKTFFKYNAPFANSVFLIAEDSQPDCPIFLIAEDQPGGENVYLIAEDGNTPSFDDSIYYSLFKPYIALYSSDDGGITFQSHDVREFSPRGAYRWRMRWYELGTSRNRVYKLICVSSAPIVLLGAVHERRRASGGAN